ncbi:MarR family winged helix-turn-helix transcriptional regulator [Arthrobacter sp. B3I4]|uniref:MarR family winged helix-turn-helix transcriptional regulator n=1 Tax=Arthrobacter sp. B3I4 TaxID=3042267 RepID=UPI00277D9C5C|nr:MarR family transcriptional regulator [Arthrobacter sp. B3I4]MDQ0755094.1 DNA-binding MarR family transcriptional regulator [Arthrobacter sp. B3I4]
MHPSGESEGYWYPARRDGQPSGVDVLNALRDYRASETAMRRRTRDSMAMGETDLLALRYLLEAETAGVQVRPKELATRLGMTSASMTALVDRMVASGYITREPHPSDRRAIILRPTPGADEEVRHTLGRMHQRMLEIANSLTPEDARAVVGFLLRMREAVDTIDAG